MPTAITMNGTSTSSKRLCRWGIIGCDVEAASFVRALSATHGEAAGGIEQATRRGSSSISSTARQSSKTLIEHIVVSLAAQGNKDDAAAFQKQHQEMQVFATSIEMLDSASNVDCIFVSGTPNRRYMQAHQALMRGKSVVICNPVAMTRDEAQDLCDEARAQTQSTALVFAMLSNGDDRESKLLAAANACAEARLAGQAQSRQYPWSETLTVLEVLQDLYQSGALLASGTESLSSTPFPKDGMDSADASPLIQDVRRPASRTSLTSEGYPASPVLGDDASSTRTTAMLRSQLQELKHVLRQKTAAIASLELKAGVSLGATERQLERSRGRASLTGNNSAGEATSPAFQEKTTPRSVGKQSMGPDDQDSSARPFEDVSNTSDGTSALATRRRRKDATSKGIHEATTAVSKANVNQLGLENVVEGSSSKDSSYSNSGVKEKRRVSSRPSARLSSPSTPIDSSFPTRLSNGSGRSGEESMSEAARIQLRISQRTVTTLQHALDEERANVARARAEAAAAKEALSQKERQVNEVLERARKAETEARELGKSSREWGARVRKIEGELGEERMHKQRIEMQYDALSTSWKQTREAWEREMNELRQNQGEAVRKNREDAQSILAKFQAAQKSWAEREAVGSELHSVLGALESERRRATNFVEQPVRQLVSQLEKHERHTSKQDAAVTEVQGELRRILRLMRSPLQPQR